MAKLTFKPVYLFNLFWLTGLLHISYYGSKPYPHYMFDQMMTPDTQAVFITCGIFSIYFIAGNILRLTPLWQTPRYWPYIFLSALLVFQAFIAFIGAMHAPPYWGALIINCMFMLLAHFVFYPLYAISKKYTQKKNTA